MILELYKNIQSPKLSYPASNMGRPTVMTEFNLRKLEQAFMFDCTVSEACLYADISRDTYYAFIQKYPDFSDRFKALRLIPVIIARITVVAGLTYDFNLAMWYLKAKRPEEFGH
jgi:hypothetical protein